MRSARPTRPLSTLHRSLATLLVLGLSGAPCVAQAPGKWEITLSGGLYIPGDLFQPSGGCFGHDPSLPPCPATQPPTHSVFAGGGRVTAWVSRRIAVEGAVEYSTSTEADDITAANVRLLFGLAHTGKTWWYLTGGPAVVSHTGRGGNSGFGGVLGGGAHIGFAPRLALRVEFEEYLSYANGESYRDPFWLVGVSIAP